MPETKTSDEKLLHALRDILPPNLRLYDFSEGVSVFPMPAKMPDFGEGVSWLTTTLCVLEDSERGKYLSVEVTRKRDTDPKDLLESTNIIEQLVKAVPLFEERSVPSLEDATKKEHPVR